MPRHFNHWIEAYVQHTRYSESPTPFHLWTAISTVAGALRRRVWKSELHFEWTPNFYVVLVGPPGVAAKSTSIGTGMAMLREVEGVAFGPQSATWQSIPVALEESLQWIELENGSGLKEQIPMCALTIPLSEFGTFMKTADTSMTDLLVDLWDGRRDVWKHKTKTTGETEVQNPWINIIGCTTPAWLRQHFSEDMIGGGFASRVVFVYGEKKRHFVAYPSRQVLGSDYKAQHRLLVEDLQQIALLKGEFQLEESAYEWGEWWYKTLWESRPIEMADERYSGYIGRKQTHLHKLAMVIAASKRDNLLITREDLQEADRMLVAVEPHMAKVFEAVGYVQEARHLDDILAYLRVFKVMPVDELFSRLCSRISKRDFVAAVNTGLESKAVEKTMHNGLRAIRIANGKAD